MAENPNLFYRTQGLRWRGKLPIPKHAHPLVRDLYRAINAADATLSEVSREAGLCRGVIAGWGRKAMPRAADLDAALNVVGLRLAIVPKDDA